MSDIFAWAVYSVLIIIAYALWRIGDKIDKR